MYKLDNMSFINPLEIKSDPELRHQRIETMVLYPRYCDDATCEIILPHRGYLNAASRIIIPAICKDAGFQYPPTAGVFALIKTATLRVGDNVVCQVDNANMLYAMRNTLSHLERREKIDCPYKGINSSFETCSGGKRLGSPDTAEVFGGQMRLVCDRYESLAPSTRVVGSENARPCLVNGKLNTAYRLHPDEDTTPEFSVTLGELFVGFFGNMDLPLQLINNDDEVAIELVFSDNGDWGANDRCILCPELQQQLIQTTRGTISVAKDAIFPGGNFAPDRTGVIKDYPAQGGFRFMYDISGGVPINIRVLDVGVGSADNERYELASTTGVDADKLVLVVARKLDNTQGVLGVIVGGTNYVNGAAVLVSNVNPDCNASCTITVNAGAIATATIDSTPGNIERFACDTDGTYTVRQENNTNAVVQVTGALYSCAPANVVGAFTVGDLINKVGEVGVTGYIVELDDINNEPIKIRSAFGIWPQDPIDIEKTNDNAITATLSNLQLIQNSTTLVGHGTSLHSFNNLADEVGGTVEVVSKKVRMMCDLIYYEGGKFEADAKQMMGEGFTKVYTEFRNVESTIDGDAAQTYGASNAVETVRLVGLSNEILRSLTIAKYPSGVQNNPAFEHYGLNKTNPLLNKYCSHDSLVENGVSLQVLVNSVPRYSAPLDFNPYLYVELADVFGGALYVPQGAYNGSSSCKQLDDKALADTQQVGFFKTNALEATRQYEINTRKAGIANQSYEGIDQKYLIGMQCFLGCNFRKVPMNVAGNGIACGNQAVEVQLTYRDTYNPYYSGQSQLAIFAEVERMFKLVKGKVMVSTSSM